MAERIPGAEIVIFEDSSHFFLVEEPERFAATLDAWLRRHTPGV
jgi:pimeloyl-ACP methyl ester carboxylesterase